MAARTWLFPANKQTNTIALTTKKSSNDYELNNGIKYASSKTKLAHTSE
jgi:hypothetical protein